VDLSLVSAASRIAEWFGPGTPFFVCGDLDVLWCSTVEGVVRSDHQEGRIQDSLSKNQQSDNVLL
jgi:hypothetical protein